MWGQNMLKLCVAISGSCWILKVHQMTVAIPQPPGRGTSVPGRAWCARHFRVGRLPSRPSRPWLPWVPWVCWLPWLRLPRPRLWMLQWLSRLGRCCLKRGGMWVTLCQTLAHGRMLCWKTVWKTTINMFLGLWDVKLITYQMVAGRDCLLHFTEYANLFQHSICTKWNSFQHSPPNLNALNVPKPIGLPWT